LQPPPEYWDDRMIKRYRKGAELIHGEPEPKRNNPDSLSVENFRKHHIKLKNPISGDGFRVFYSIHINLFRGVKTFFLPLHGEAMTKLFWGNFGGNYKIERQKLKINPIG